MTIRPRFFAVAAVVLLTSATASAWETRVLTLGDQNRFIEDDANIWLYPQTLTKYGERLYLDLDRKAGRIVDSIGETIPGTTTGIEYDGVAKTVNGGTMLQILEGFNIGIWTSGQTDSVTRTFLQGVQQVQNDIGARGPGGACSQLNNEFGNDNCRLSNQQITGDELRDGTQAGDFPGGLLRFNQDSSRKFDLFAGIDLSESLALGFRLFWGNSSAVIFEQTTVDLNTGDPGDENISNERIFDSTLVGGGAGLSVGVWDGGKLDIGVRLTRYTYELSENGVFKPAVDGGTSFTLDSRLTGRLSKHWWFVPSLQLSFLSFTGAVDNETAPGQDTGLGNDATLIDWSAVNFDLGVGLQMRVIGKASLYTAWGLDFGRNTFHANSNWGADRLLTITRLQLPYWKAGFEAPLWDWLDFRAGFTKRWSRFRIVDDFLDPGSDNGKIVEDNGSKGERRRRGTRLSDASFSEDAFNLLDDFDTWVGATMHHAGWYFATEIDPTLLFNGPFRNATYSVPTGVDADGNLITQTNPAPWFARFEISYRF